MRTRALFFALVVATVAGGTFPAQAIHLYRGPGGGCTPADGVVTDDPENETGPEGAVEIVLHNTFNDTSTNAPVTFIEAGQSIRWRWWSQHCHSVTGAGWDSGFHYPLEEPTSPKGVAGVVDYPVADGSDVTLEYVHTFKAPGTYMYQCVHHGLIGMQGVVVVE